MTELFSVENIAFTVLGYPMSYVELFGTALYLWSVWLISRRKILTWPVGIASVLLYMTLFYQIRLYVDAFEQIYYLAASVYGWWLWTHSPRKEGAVLDVRFSPSGQLLTYLASTFLFAIAVGVFASRVHIFFPSLFPEEAAYPYLDALTTIMSFTAMWLMVNKRTESWIY